MSAAALARWSASGPGLGQMEGCPKVYAVADEDLERETERKLVGALPALRAGSGHEESASGGANIRMGVDHPNYQPP
jgi:hypothetical protein